MHLSKECFRFCHNSKRTLAKVVIWLDSYQCSHLPAFTALTSFYTAPTNCTAEIANQTPHWEVFIGSADITISSPPSPVTVTMARKARALSTGARPQPFPLAAFTSRGCYGDQPYEHNRTVRQTCQKGRRDVLFSHTMSFILCVPG